MFRGVGVRRFDVVISAILLAVCLLLAHKRRQAQRIRDRQNQDVQRATPGEYSYYYYYYYYQYY